MTELAHLYETNYTEWAKRNAELLKVRRFAEIDIPHLLDELSDMGKAETNELENRLIILLAHLLKWQFQYRQLSGLWAEFEGKNWRNTIIEQRKRIARRLRKSLGLKSYLPEAIVDTYEDALDLASKESGLALKTFPRECPYTKTQILDDDDYPESEN